MTLTLRLTGCESISFAEYGTSRFSSGNYQLSDLASGGSYTVTPSKTGDVNGINSLDATRIQQHLVELITLSPAQLIAADVTNNGVVSSIDAARLQQYLVGIQSAQIAGQWKFMPVNRQYNSVTGNLTGENYQAVLVGEVSGNWTPPANFAEYLETKEEMSLSASEPFGGNRGFTQKSDVTASAPIEQSRHFHSRNSKSKLPVNEVAIVVSPPSNATAPVGSTITIPVTIEALSSGTNIESFDFSVFYDPAVLRPVASVAGNSDALSADCSVLSNSPRAGKVIVSGVCGNQPVTNSSGVLYNLQFVVVGNVNQQTALSFTNPATSLSSFQFNNGISAAITSDGKFTVTY
jgi:hypothetical protein